METAYLRVGKLSVNNLLREHLCLQNSVMEKAESTTLEKNIRCAFTCNLGTYLGIVYQNLIFLARRVIVETLRAEYNGRTVTI